MAEWSIAPVLKTGLRRRNGGSNPSPTAMKVTVIIPDSMSTPTGGLGVQFNNLYSRLNNHIDFCIVGYPEDNPPPNYIPAETPLPELQHGSLNTLIGHTIYLAKALEFGKPDIVHAYDWSTYFAGYYVAKYFKVPLLVTMQLSVRGLGDHNIYNCMNFNSKDGQWIHKYHTQMEEFVLKNSDQIICVSNGYQKYIPKVSLNKTKIIPNGIDLKQWQTTKSLPSLPGSNKYKIAYIGRFAEMKGVSELMLADIPSGIDLILIGSPNGGDNHVISLIEEVKKEKNNVYYVGPYYGQDKIDILNQMDAVIMPSKHEPFGIVALEALASKSILLSSRVDGMGDFLTNQNSILVSPGVSGVEKAFNAFLKLSFKEKNNMIQEGLKTCLNYKWDDIAQQYLKVYNSMV